jgi:hypothetical protein
MRLTNDVTRCAGASRDGHECPWRDDCLRYIEREENNPWHSWDWFYRDGAMLCEKQIKGEA